MVSFINTDLDGDIILSMKRPKFASTLSKLELSKATQITNPITVLHNVIEHYEDFLAYCPTESNATTDNAEYFYNYKRSSYSSYGNYGEAYDYDSFNEELCQDELNAQFNTDIELGHARLLNNSTSKVFYVVGFSLFDSINAQEIDSSYEKLITLLKLWIVYFFFIYMFNEFSFCQSFIKKK